MGEFKAGTWAVLLGLYFFMLFIAVHSTVNSAYEFDIDSDVGDYNDPGFNIDTEYSKDIECRDGSLPGITAFCSQTKAYNYGSCEIIPGCHYSNSSKECKGIINLIDYGGECKSSMPKELCLVLGCAVDTATGQPIVRIENSTEGGYTTASTEGYNSLVDTLMVLMGFDVDLNLPQQYGFIYSFIFFWIPFLMLAFCLYMMTPFAH